MRPSLPVAGAILSLALVLVGVSSLSDTAPPPSYANPLAAPAIAAMRTASDVRPVEPEPLAAFRRAEVLGIATFVEPGAAPPPPPARLAVGVPAAGAGWDWKPPRYTLSGYASFYRGGHTAMRLPRGTVVVICGASGCIQRVIDDYGPNARIHPTRIADLDVGDFFRICGCPSWSGTTWVQVRVY